MTLWCGSRYGQTGMKVVDFRSTSKRQSGGRLWATRVIWIILLILTVWKITLGLPLYYTEVSTICTDAEKICSQGISLTPRQVEALESAGLSLNEYAKLDLVWKIVTTVIWAGVGIFIFLLRPNDRIAWIASAMMVVFNSAGYETQIRLVYPALGVAAEFIFNLGNVLLFLFIGLFPNGRFSPRWMRWYWSGMILISFLPLGEWIQQTNLYNAIILIFWVSFLILGPYSQIYKYRNESTNAERLQTRWIILGFAVFAGAVLVGFTLITMFQEVSLGRIIYQTFVFDLAGLLIPLSIGISILHYRLWDIDVVIRRTLQYSLLTGLLALSYLGGVVVLQSFLSPITGSENHPLITVITTLGIAALFNPLRIRVQNFIDRRFYRKKYNAEQALAQFAAVTRDEVDMDRLTAALLRVVEETVQPEQVSLWLRLSEKPRPNRPFVGGEGASTVAEASRGDR